MFVIEINDSVHESEKNGYNHVKMDYNLIIFGGNKVHLYSIIIDFFSSFVALTENLK